MSSKRHGPDSGKPREPDGQTDAARPTPVDAIASKHAQMSAGFASRDDRFSQLLSKLLQDEFSMGGQALISRSGLSPEEFAELKSLAEAASEAFREEMADAVSRLRELLAQGDPLYTLSVIQMTNVMVAAGSYYEPTHVGMESKVELVAGLLLSQECPTGADPVTDDVLGSICEELDHVLEVSLLRNLSAAHGEDQITAELRFTSAMSWMTLRGTSFAHHGTELAAAVYRPFDNWCLDRYGFTFDDVIEVGSAVEALVTDRLNSLLDEARVFGELGWPGGRSRADENALISGSPMNADYSLVSASPSLVWCVGLPGVPDCCHEHACQTR